VLGRWRATSGAVSCGVYPQAGGYGAEGPSGFYQELAFVSAEACEAYIATASEKFGGLVKRAGGDLCVSVRSSATAVKVVALFPGSASSLELSALAEDAAEAGFDIVAMMPTFKSVFVQELGCVTPALHAEMEKWKAAPNLTMALSEALPIYAQFGDMAVEGKWCVIMEVVHKSAADAMAATKFFYEPEMKAASDAAGSACFMYLKTPATTFQLTVRAALGRSSAPSVFL
jgi:hypothetical protein